MKKLSNAIRLYAKATLHPFTIGFGLFMAIGMSLAFIIDPDPVGSDEYLSMLGALQMGHIGIIFMVIIGNSRLQQNKFYSSCSCAKLLYITAPAVFMTAATLLYDLYLGILALISLGTAGLSDAMVFNAFSSAMSILFSVCYGKRNLGVLAALPYFGFLVVPMIAKRLPIEGNTLGLSLDSAVLITVGAYLAAIVLAIVIGSLWWKNGDKFAMPNKLVQNVVEGQS